MRYEEQYDKTISEQFGEAYGKPLNPGLREMGVGDWLDKVIWFFQRLFRRKD